MKKAFFTLLLIVAGLSSYAQEPQTPIVADSTVQAPTPKPLLIGCLSYDEALRSMPQYAIVEAEMEQLQQAYQAELKRVEDDFNQKYEAFLDGRKDFPRTILLKRQTELQELMQKNIAFKEQARRELQKAEADAMAPLKDSLKTVLSLLVEERGYAFILNTDANAFPAISPTMGEDVNDVVLQMLSNGESAK